MLRRLTALAATAVLATTGLALSPTPASADNGVYVTGATVDSFYMGTESAKTFTVKISATGAGMVDWSIESANPDCWIFDYGDAVYRGGGLWTDTFTVTRNDTYYSNACAGAMVLDVSAYAGDYSGSDDASYVVNFKRQARIVSQNFGPEPVRKGGTVTGTARLERVSWKDYAYHGDANAPIYSQFRTTSGSYSTVRSTYTDSAGYVTSKNTQSVDGCWRFYAPGYSTTSSYKATGDCVDVS